MRLQWSIAAVLFMSIAALLQGQPRKQRDPNIAATEAVTPAEERKKFHLPPGFEIQLVAAEPTIKKPINIAFDAKGRLWVTGSEEYPFPAPPERKPKDKLVILEDFGPDGLARKSTVFADGLNIPIGVLPMPDCKSALVYSIPNIWMLTDTDGDGKADKKEAMYTGFGYQDTHGMTGEFVWGFDGWVYCCHGYANTSHVKAVKGDTSIKMQSGNTYRIKPDGSRIEQYTWGQVNPFGLCFDPLGNLYSTDCHTRPLYQLLKGAYYPSFGKPHDGLGFGPEMVTHDHGSTAIAGIAYYAADHYPKEFHDNLFVGNVITNRINRDRIEWHGSTPKGIEMPDLVKSDDPWFRPVDIKLGPDGALYVADFYTRIIGHYEVPLNHPMRDFDKGRIWRIVYRGPDGVRKPDEYRPMPERSDEELVAALGHGNLTVRTFATNELVARDRRQVLKELVPILTNGSAYQQIHALWVIERLVTLRHGDIEDALESPIPFLRVQAAKVLGERKAITAKEGELLRTCLKDANPLLQRAAAEALGSHPGVAEMNALVRLRSAIPRDDQQLLHVVRMAMRNQFRNVEVAKDLLYQPGVGPEKEDTYEAVSDVCLGMPSAEAATFLYRYGLVSANPPSIVQERIRHIVRYGTSTTRSDLLKVVREAYSNRIDYAAASIKGIVQGNQERGGKFAMAERQWIEQIIGRLLDSTAAPRLQDGIHLAGAIKLASAVPTLLGITKNPQQPEAQRKSAIVALVAIEPVKHVDVLERLLLDDGEKIGVREQCAASLAAANQPEAFAALTLALEKVPARLQTSIAQVMAASPQGANQLLDAVAAGKASARLLQDRAIELRLRAARVADLDARLAKLTKGLPAADQKALELLAKRKHAFAAAQTDVKLGRMLFEKHCANCHIIANQGSKIGPQLDGIGIRGLERLLEDTLDPSRNVDQAFRSTTLELDNGQFVSGLLLREEGKVLVLADNLGKEVRIEGSMVANRTVGQLSPMPANFAEQIGEQDFHHLMAYLLDQRIKR